VTSPRLPQSNHRSLGFLDLDGQKWSCFLVTRRSGSRRWVGQFLFRPGEGETTVEVATAEIFSEDSEGEIEHKARSMGRPLLAGLLASAREVSRNQTGLPGLEASIQELLARSGRGGDREEGERLLSLYDSYRLDQVAHLIALVHPEDFEEMVYRIIGDALVDFSARDRTQLALLVVHRLESLLPLPPFEVWAADYLADPDAYRVYAHRLHRGGGGPVD
jgi:hypothetical protein